MVDTNPPESRGNPKVSSLRQQAETIGSLDDRFARTSLRIAYHFRRYSAVYVIATLSVLTLALLPTVGQSTSSQLASGAGSAPGGSSGGEYPNPGNLAGTSPSATASVTASGAASGVGPSGFDTGPVGTVVAGTGTTRGGFACHPGVRQVPYSAYAPACVERFTGNNGGATSNGVTRNTITIAIRHTSDSTGANAASAQAIAAGTGNASNDTMEQYTKQIVAYFNKNYEFYGRQIKLVDFNGQGNYNNENMGQDQATACADADALETSVHAFGEFDYEYNYETGVFSECAGRYHVYLPFGGPSFPENWYRSLDPYVWAGSTECMTGDEEVAEFIGKQLAPYPAKWAGNDGATNMQNTQRKFGTYVPDNAGYLQCVANMNSVLKTKYKVSSSRLDQYSYALDFSTFPQDAQKAIIQFAANGDTDVILSCDVLSPIFLTQDAAQQNYHPEWILTGVGLTDTDSWAELWDQAETNGHLFGLSQLGDTPTEMNPHGEAAQALAAAGVPLNASSALDYYELLPLAIQIQAAGPILTPAHLAAGTHALPEVGGSTAAAGSWYYGNTHTAIIDSREVYWEGSQTSAATGRQGTYVTAYNGRRFRLGQYPSGQPAVYP